MNIEYREYKETDLDKCANLSVDAWPVIQLVTLTDCDLLMKAYVKICFLLSDYSVVCVDENKVIGFLFGAIRKRLPDIKQKTDLWKLLYGFITGKFGKIKKPVRFLLSFISTSIKVGFLTSKFDSEIVLFVVDSDYRGKGIGRSLITKFIDIARQNEKKTVYLYTDIESNWYFYEKVGFKKYKDFYDPEVSFMRGLKTKSYIYYKNI